MTAIHGDGVMATAQQGLGVGGMAWRGSRAVVGSCQPSLLTPAGSRGDASTEGPDPSFRRSYMRALMEFAENTHDGGMLPLVDDIDADSLRSGGDEEDQQVHDSLDSPGSEKAVNKPGFASRISRVPFTWEPGEAAESKREPRRDRQDGDINPDLTPHDIDTASLVDVFQPFSFSSIDNLELVQLPGIDSAAEEKRKLSSVSVGLGTVQEDHAVISFPGDLEVGIAVTDFDACTDSASVSSTRHQQNPSVSTTGRPSTSTTQSSGSMSVASIPEDTRSKRKPSPGPRRSGDLFKRFRGRAGAPEDFIERRCLTPHSLLAPSSQHFGQDPQEECDDGGSTFRNLLGNSKSVFGVDLEDSIRLAPMKIRISHRGSSTSYRTFPLSVYKCCEFIRQSPIDSSLFSSPGDSSNVSQLLTMFNTPPYGEDFSFSDPENSHYTIHDAGRVILLFLRDLPNPLVSASVVKSWITLARYEGAIEPPCDRPLESGLEFWAEALNRLPVANRNLTKQLLTLFAYTVTKWRDSRGRGVITDADARNLASAVARAMFHTEESGKSGERRRNVHATLALAFLLKKRGEYVTAMGKSERGEEGGEEPGFLPSTKEMLEWRLQ